MSNKKIKIVIDDKIPFIRGVLEPFADVLYLPGAGISVDDVKDADALIVRTRTKCGKELLDGSSVKFIATATIGFDHIDTDYCESRNITWVSAPGCNSYSVQQYIASVLLNIGKNEGFSLKDKTIGIVGVGNVGSKVAKFADILGMRVLLNDPPLEAGIAGVPTSSLAKKGVNQEPRSKHREIEEASLLAINPTCGNKKSISDLGISNGKFVSLEEIQKEADFITFHTPLNREGEYSTYHLVNDDFFDKVSEDVWIINSSRGEVVDNLSLKKALKNGKIAGAILDVWENEPNIDLELLELLTYATPHIAGYSADGKANGTMMSVEACSRFFGLGIDGWAPKNVPIPDNNSLSLDCDGEKFENLLRVAMLATYDIKCDDANLRNAPDEFEKQRGGYSLRREPLVYHIELQNNSAEFADKFLKLRFLM